jgi:hypothetical protein
MLVENKVKENQSSRRDETLVKSTSIIDLTNIASLRDAIDFMTSEIEMLTLETEKGASPNDRKFPKIPFNRQGIALCCST